MQNKELFVGNAIVVILMILAGGLTFSIFSNESFSEILKERIYSNFYLVELEQQEEELKEEILDGRCSKKEALFLSVENDPHLKKLAEYQELCQSFVTDSLMFFTSFPYSRDSASEEATSIASKLKLFHKNGVYPIVIVEPYAGGEPVDYKGFLAGGYNVALDNYFSALLESGVTEEMMGTWVPFPESNTPNWENKNTEPKDFALAVNKYLSYLRKYYPEVKGSVLLNSTTYDPNDLEWNNGDYLSLIPYLEDVDKSTIKSFGIQGFPWVSNATIEKTRQIFRASEFIQPDLAIISAQELRTKDIWINTGTFSAKYIDDDAKKIEVSLNDRKAILNGILSVAKELEEYQLNGYRVSINLFSEDKSGYTEATDWSYFQSEDSRNLLKEFLRKAEEFDIHVSLFDMEHKSVPSDDQGK